MSGFKKAEKKRAKLKVALSGPSGSGKTYSALMIAKGIGGKIALIDTENDSASLYADQFEFDTLTLTAPFTTEKYINAMKMAEKDYDILIIDSATHQWMGDGGLYERKTTKDARGGNSFTNWAEFTPEHNKFLNAIVQHPSHLICTVRSKQDYVVEANERGKQAPRKVGMAPVQREGFEYEFTVMFDIAMNHTAQASKDRTSMFDQAVFKPSEETGKALLEWLLTGKEIWIFGQKEREELRNMMNLVASGKTIIKTWEEKNGSINGITEEQYGALMLQLKAAHEIGQQQAAV